ncbi:hypothetical protein GCM10022389_19520 [Flavobacterium cheonanense]|uniref:Uncharacterized protein n=1 Tax=Flavobacterium cheonanense TaxID=706183 RepID=A0ABP7VTC7_9FLAO
MRQVINVNDIMVFFNKKERQSYKMIAEMKKSYNKEAHQPITIKEFADYYNIPQETITTVMQANDLIKTQQKEDKKLKLDLAKEANSRVEEAKKLQLLEKLAVKEKETPRFTFNKS